MEITHAAKVLARDFRGDLMVVDIGEVEVHDLIFYSGHLIRRVLTRPRDRMKTENTNRVFVYETESLDTDTTSKFQTAVGTAVLILRPY